MKKMVIIRCFLVLALVALLLGNQACGSRLVNTPYEYDGFTRLDIQNAFNVEIVQSGTYGISITSSKELLDYLSISRAGDTLVIKLQPNHPFTDFATMRKILKAKIAMPVIYAVTLSGACEGTIRGFQSADKLELDVSGASHLDLNQIEAGDARLVISGDSRISGKLTAANVKFDVSGASKLDLAGTAADCQILAVGASRLNLEFFVHQTASITMSGASQTTVDTRKHLDFSLNGASQLFFLSNPNIGKMEILGASTVKHK